MAWRHATDYENSAPDYAERRTPTEARLAVWARAIGPHLHDADMAIDLGAGTGGFSGALHDWGATRVIAIEPSTAMQAKAVHVVGVHQVRGRAEMIPRARAPSRGRSAAACCGNSNEAVVGQVHGYYARRGPRATPQMPWNVGSSASAEIRTVRPRSSSRSGTPPRAECSPWATPRMPDTVAPPVRWAGSSRRRPLAC